MNYDLIRYSVRSAVVNPIWDLFDDTNIVTFPAWKVSWSSVRGLVKESYREL